ncbi:MAG TPA: HAD family hydrolase [Dehalococcoidia bacterium]|nr:HAD family hydrolase [Dehalococcoidia bacterium]
MRNRALCLDLDGTLLDDEASVEISIDRAVQELAAAYPALELSGLANAYRSGDAAFWDSPMGMAVMRGEVAGADGRLARWRDALSLCSCDDDAVAASVYEAYVCHRNSISIVYPDTAQLLAALPADVSVAIITNGPKLSQREKLQTASLDTAAHVLAISGELGFAKPDARIFRYALEALGVEPKEALHVGDSLQNDVGGANAAGLTSVWLNRNAAKRRDDDPLPHHEIASLRELLTLV